MNVVAAIVEFAIWSRQSPDKPLCVVASRLTFDSLRWELFFPVEHKCYSTALCLGGFLLKLFLWH